VVDDTGSTLLSQALPGDGDFRHRHDAILAELSRLPQEARIPFNREVYGVSPPFQAKEERAAEALRGPIVFTKPARSAAAHSRAEGVNCWSESDATSIQ